MIVSGMVLGVEGGGIQQVNTPNALAPVLVIAPEPSVPILVEDADDTRMRRKMYCWGGGDFIMFLNTLCYQECLCTH
jgi:hypothetical protein